MKLPARYLVALCASTALILAGCSADDTTAEPATNSAADSPDTTTDADATGGTCDVTVISDEVPKAADEAASLAALENVVVTGGVDSAPTVTYEAPLAIGTEVVAVVTEGSGDAIQDGDMVTFNYVVCDMVTGEKMYSTWGLESADDAPETYEVSADNFGEVLAGALVDATPGTNLLWATPGLSAEESGTGEAVNGFLYVMTITDAQTVLSEAEGTEVTPADDTLPQISFVDGKPAVTVPESFTDPTDLVVQPLIQGEGDVVEAGQTVLVKYTGWLTDGTQFDSSWDRESPDDVFSFPVGMGSVIIGWDEGVAGQNVGSRVLLVIPSEKGYGEIGTGTIPANSSLIFVVDILAAY